MSMKKMLAVAAAAALVAVAAPAFAANPFSDVPMNHWAYDAVAQLSARGVLSGYPDGTFKGNKPMTRYEIASMVARSLANAEYATKEDMERLKKLVVEFQPELEALGVTVDGFDSRLTALEKGVGGWKIWGELRFDAAKTDQVDTKWKDNQKWDSSRYRIWMNKQVSDKVSFTARIGNLGGSYRNFRNSADMAFDRYYLTVNDFLVDNLTLTAGMYLNDWDGEDGMYTDWDSIYTDFTVKGYELRYKAAMGEFAVMGGANGDQWGARAKFNFNEKFWLSLNAIWDNRENVAHEAGTELVSIHGMTVYTSRADYWASAGFKFTPGVELKGSYGVQKLDGHLFDIDDPSVWRVILDVKQDVLKFTSLWVEYDSIDAGFVVRNEPYAEFAGKLPVRTDALGNLIPALTTYGALSDVKVLFVKAGQKWTDKWSTWVRYVRAKDGVINAYGDSGDSKEWGLGVKYQYTPALSFELAYADQDYDNVYEDDNIIRFRTHLKF